MKISELIHTLTDVLAEKGDIPVNITCLTCNGDVNFEVTGTQCFGSNSFDIEFEPTNDEIDLINELREVPDTEE